MPNAAVLFLLATLSLFVIPTSFAFVSNDLIVLDDSNNNSIIFDSDILEVDSSFFTENDVKRYLIFGNNSQDADFLKNNLIN